MKPTVYAKLEGLQERHEEVEALLGDPDTIANQDLFRALNQEYAKLGPVIEAFNTYKEAQDNFESAQEMLKDEDPDMREMAQEEFKEAKAAIAEIEEELQILLLPTDPNDDRNAFLEIRAGAGGDEAAIFAGDLYRMYSRHIENKGWRVEIITMNETHTGGTSIKQVLTYTYHLCSKWSISSTRCKHVVNQFRKRRREFNIAVSVPRGNCVGTV